MAVTILLRIQRGWWVLFFLIWLTFLLLILGLARLLIFIIGVIRVLALLCATIEIIVLQEMLAQAFPFFLRREKCFQLSNRLPYLGLIRCIVQQSSAEFSTTLF